MKKELKKKDIKRLEQTVDEIDYTALVARLAGEPLSSEQEASCRKFDSLYDATHPGNASTGAKKR